MSRNILLNDLIFFSFSPLKWFQYLFYIYNNVWAMQPATDLESQPYSWHRVLWIRAGSCLVMQQHHTAPPQLMGPDITAVLSGPNYLNWISAFLLCGCCISGSVFSGLCFSPELNLSQAFLQTWVAQGSTLFTRRSWSWNIMFAHSNKPCQNMNIRDKIISYRGQAVEDLLLSSQRAGSQAVPCGHFSCLTQHCCTN